MWPREDVIRQLVGAVAMAVQRGGAMVLSISIREPRTRRRIMVSCLVPLVTRIKRTSPSPHASHMLPSLPPHLNPPAQRPLSPSSALTIVRPVLIAYMQRS